MKLCESALRVEIERLCMILHDASDARLRELIAAAGEYDILELEPAKGAKRWLGQP